MATVFVRSARCCSKFFSQQPSYVYYSTALPSAVGFDDYEKACKTYRLRAPKYFNFVSDVIDQWALRERKEGRKLPALWWVNDKGTELKWSFTQLVNLSSKAANVLTGPLGLKKGDRVIAILPRLPQWWLLNLACVRTGIVLLPGTVMLTPEDIQFRLQSSKATCVITDDAHMDHVDAVLPQCPGVKSKAVIGDSRHRKDWLDFDEHLNQASAVHQCVETLAEDPMQIFFTSGTTGKPKMTLHTQASYGLGHVYTGRHWLDLTDKDIMWNMSDTGWAKAAYCSVFAPWLQGACSFVQHSEHKFDPVSTLKNLEMYPITGFFSPATGYAMLVQEKLADYKLNAALRHCTSGGESLNPEVALAWLRGTGQQARQGYGQTETVLVCGSFRCLQDKPGSIGKPSPGVDLTIVDDEGKEVGVGQEGNIAIYMKPERPFWLFREYVDDPQRTAKAFNGDYFLFGDRGFKDEDGYLWFVGRSDDVIISAGYRIGPFEVESALIEHPAVVESAVVSSPDPTRGEVVKAFVIRSEAYKNADKTALTKELQDHVRQKTAAYKYPRKVEFVDQLPKTISGKIRRVELRNKEWQEVRGQR